MKQILLGVLLTVVSQSAGGQTAPVAGGRVCVDVLDEKGASIRDVKVEALRIVGREVSAVVSDACLTGESGSTFVVRAYAKGFYTSTVLIELDGMERRRIVRLRPGFLESSSTTIAGDVECRKAQCVLKAVQIDGEHVYTVGISGLDHFKVEGPRPGLYALVFQRNGVVTCTMTVSVRVFSGDYIRVDLEKCASRTL